MSILRWMMFCGGIYTNCLWLWRVMGVQDYLLPQVLLQLQRSLELMPAVLLLFWCILLWRCSQLVISTYLVVYFICNMLIVGWLAPGNCVISLVTFYSLFKRNRFARVGGTKGEVFTLYGWFTSHWLLGKVHCLDIIWNTNHKKKFLSFWWCTCILLHRD